MQPTQGTAPRRKPTFFSGDYDEPSDSYVDSLLRDNQTGTCYAAPTITRTSPLILPAGPGYRITVASDNLNPRIAPNGADPCSLVAPNRREPST